MQQCLQKSAENGEWIVLILNFLYPVLCGIQWEADFKKHENKVKIQLQPKKHQLVEQNVQSCLSEHTNFGTIWVKITVFKEALLKASYDL